jgi:hypothetical protein
MNGLEAVGIAVAVTAMLGAAIAPTPAAAQTLDIEGVVRDSINGEPLPNASVGIVALGQRVATDAFGRFSLIAVPGSPHVIRVEAIGYRTTDFPWDGPGVGPLVLRVAPQAVQLEGISVGPTSEVLRVDERISEITIDPRSLSSLPTLGETDVFRGLQLLPGVSGTRDASSGLFVRGGTPDENLVLLDGMTIYHVDHFFGVFSAFNSDAIKDVRLFKGGFPARFGGRTSSVVEMTGKTGDANEFRLSGGINLLSARALAEVPLGGRGSWLVSVRRSYTDVIQSSLFDDIFGTLSATENDDGTIRTGSGRAPSASSGTPSFHFYDVNSKATFTPTDRDVVAISLYAGEDDLDESSLLGLGSQEQAADTLDLTDVTAWGNRGASARWSRRWNSRVTTDLLASTSLYFSDSRTNADAGFVSRGFQEENEVRDVTVRLHNSLFLRRGWELGFGAQHTDHRISYERIEQEGDSIVGSLDLGGEGALTSGYLDVDGTLFGRLRLTIGTRVSAYEPTGETYIEPRASLRLELTDRIALKGAWGRFYQFVKRVENEDILEGSRDFWVLTDDELRPASSEQVVAGVAYETPSFLVDVEAYDRQLGGVSQFSVRSREETDQDLSTAFFSGTGTARGVEILAQKKTGRLTGWVSYALSEVVHDLEGFNDGQPFPASHDQRHEFKVVGSYRVNDWTLSSSFIYGSGSPYTIPESQYPLRLLDSTTLNYVQVGEKNGQRLPSYQRLDLSASRRFETRKWFIDVNASVFNALGSKNVWYRQFDLTAVPLLITDVTSLGFTPSLGVSIGMR